MSERPAGHMWRLAAMLAAAAVLAAPPSQAQVPGCTIDDSAPMLRIYQCQEQLRITAEKSTRIAMLERDGRLVGLRIEGGAVHVDTGGARAGGFQVATPHVTTEVRGTRFAVDAEAGRTSVFVRDGIVAVRKGSDEVSLGAGEGVDADAGPSRLETRRWGAERAARLLARLGQG